MKKTFVIVGAAVVSMLIGCSNQNNRLTAADAQRMYPSGKKFNDAKDTPLTANTHFAAGQLAESEHAYPVAIAQYDEALKINPKHLPSLYRMGVLYTTLKRYPDAIKIWHLYVDATNHSADAYSNLAFCCELAGENDQAEQAYKDGLVREPKNITCRTNYGLMLARHQHVQEAIRMWQPVLSEAEIHYNLASVYEMDHRKAEAKSEYEKALACDPKFSDAKERLAALD